MARGLRLALSAVLGSCMLVATGAGAAPQALGLVASVRPTPMRCDAGGCRADLSSFCLQQARQDPELGTIYRAAPGTRVILIVTGHDGGTRRVDAAPYLAFVDDRGFTSVTARLSPLTLASLDAAAVAVEVGRDATLLPAVEVDDPDPQTMEELSLATGIDRQRAEVYFDRSGRDADAIRLTNAMINDLPPGELGRDPADDTVLQRTETDYQGAPVDPAGLRQAEEIHRNCVAKVDVTHQIGSMRSCLEGSHDILLTHTNIDFWNSLGGS